LFAIYQNLTVKLRKKSVKYYYLANNKYPYDNQEVLIRLELMESQIIIYGFADRYLAICGIDQLGRLKPEKEN
jgi:hypothetical protein